MTIDKKKIKLNVEKNPKHPKSRAYEKFKILMRFNGKPVAEFKAEEGKHPKLDQEPRWPTTELRWARHQRLVSIR